MKQHLTPEEISKKNAFHLDRANYYLEKKKNLPYHATNRRSRCQNLYHYHMQEHFKLLADVTGRPVQMSIIP